MISLMDCLSGRVVMFDVRAELLGCGDIFAELDGLRNSVEYGVRYQNCVSHEKTVDDFCALAVNCRLKIFEVVRSNKNINHPAKEILQNFPRCLVGVSRRWQSHGHEAKQP